MTEIKTTDEPLSDSSADISNESECFYINGLKADGKACSYYMHKNTGISGGPGPMGSIKSKSVTISIPRSRKAVLMHRIGFMIKLVFFVIAVAIFKPGILPEQELKIKVIISLSILIAGGFVTLILYQVNKTRSKFFFSRNYPVVKMYRKNGYRRGLHPLMSTTPVGPVYWLLRLIF